MTPDDKALAALVSFMLAGLFTFLEYIVKDTIIDGRWRLLTAWPWMLTAWLVYMAFLWTLPTI